MVQLMFLTQENKEECVWHGIAYCQKVVLNTNIVARGDGVVCVVKSEMSEFRSIIAISVFVINLVTGLCHELLPLHIKTSLPTFIRMETNDMGGGYVIIFIYTRDRLGLEVSLWKVHSFIDNSLSQNNVRAMVNLKDVDVLCIMAMMKACYSIRICQLSTKRLKVWMFSNVIH